MVSSEWLSASSTLIFLFSSIIWSSTNIDGVCCQTNNNIFPIDAISDGKTDSKQAFLNAWKKACAIDGGSMSVPLGSSFVVSEVEFVGPCVGRTGFTLLGTLIAPPLPTAPNLDYWIKFRYLNNLSIFGNGTLNGNGASSYWQITNQTTIITSLKLESIKSLEIRDITSVDSKNFHINIHNCQNVSIVNVHIRAPEESPNTDGIHVGSSDNVRISHVDIGTGDDCISLGDGATNINITGVRCGPGHGISIGSLGKYPQEKEVRSVSVTNCTLTNTTNGLRIKTFGPSPPGSVSGITFQGIIVNNVKNPIIIDQHYCPRPHSQCLAGMMRGESSVAINGVKFINIRGTSRTGVGVKIDCSKTYPCQHIDLTGLNLTFNGYPTTATCSSANVNFLQPNQLPSRCSNSSSSSFSSIDY